MCGLRGYELEKLPALFQVGSEARQVSAGKVCEGARGPLPQQCLSLECPLLTKFIIGSDHTEKASKEPRMHFLNKGDMTEGEFGDERESTNQ